MNVSMCRASLAGRYCSMSKPFTSPAKRQEKALASNRLTGAMPEVPDTRLDQAVATSLPTGDTTPRPVTTTRRRDMRTPGPGDSGYFLWVLM